MRGKKGLSPVIATVLLIGIIIVMALIVFMWIRGINEEAITKFDGENVKISCEKVKFEASYSSSSEELLVANRGIVPIYQIKAQLSGGGSHETIPVTNDDGWRPEGLLQGGAVRATLSAAGYEQLLIIPVLAGDSADGTKTYTCDEKFGVEVTL